MLSGYIQTKDNKKYWLVGFAVIILSLVAYLYSSKGVAPGNVNISNNLSLGALSAPEGAPLTEEVGPKSQKINTNGVTINVPANVFPSNTELRVSKSSVLLQDISFYVKQASVYDISTSKDFSSLSSPVILEIPNPNRNLIVLQSAGNNQWKQVAISNSDPLEISITHFSDNTFVVIEPSTDNSYLLGSSIPISADRTSVSDNSNLGEANPSADPIKTTNDFIQKYGNDYEKAILGVGETGDPQKECQEIKDLINANKDTWTFKFPSDIMDVKNHPLFSSLDMGKFLFTSESPSKVSDNLRLFWTMVQPSQDKIRQAILKSDTKLSPADILKIAVEANDNNAALGILAAHNFLKEMGNDGRNIINENLGNPFTGNLNQNVQIRSRVTNYSGTQNGKFLESEAKIHGGELASHLMSWRSNDRSLAGSYDKMGPIYHLFAAMTAATYFPGGVGGDIASNGESLMRVLGELGLTADRIDPEKGLADDCGNLVGKEVIKLFSKSSVQETKDILTTGSSGDTTFNFDWGHGAPDSSIPKSISFKNFAIDFKKHIFTASFDDQMGYTNTVTGSIDPQTEQLIGTFNGSQKYLGHANSDGTNSVATSVFSGSFKTNEFQSSPDSGNKITPKTAGTYWKGAATIIFSNVNCSKLYEDLPNKCPYAGITYSGSIAIQGDIVVK